jgi:TonB-linked SusC/RagA family outer membrane protein
MQTATLKKSEKKFLQTKLLIAMKLSVIFLFVFVFQASANGLSQKVTLNLKNATLEKLFKEINQQTGINFFYNSARLHKVNAVVTVHVKDENVEDVLTKCLENKSFTYSIVNGTIVITDKQNKANVSAAVTTVDAIATLPLPVTIKGKVVDENGNPLAGASVVVKGTQTGTQTGEKGEFELSINNTAVILQISYVGHETVIVSAKNKTQINVVLKTIVQAQQEIVVIGYGTQKKINLTGAVGIVNMNDMADRPLTNTGLALQGTVAGVYALQASGKPGDDGAVLDIRGVGTFGDNTPLILIDGFAGSINDVNANDIQSISVLKDAASSSIYGSRAANGVILITTKKGAAGKTKINFSTYYGVQSPTRLPSVLSSLQYATLHNEASRNDGTIPQYSSADSINYAAQNNWRYPNIDYFKVFYGNANILNNRLNIYGGTDRLNYAFMIGSLKQDGILVATNYKKIDFRSNVDAFFLKDNKLRISTKLSGNYGIKGEPISVWDATWYSTVAPTYQYKDSLERYMTIGGDARNPYADIVNGSTTQTKRYNINGQVEAEYKIIKDLSAQITLGYNLMTSNVNAFNANNVLYYPSGLTKTEASDLTITNEKDIQTLLTYTLRYNKKIDKHELSFLAGYSEEEFTWNGQRGYRKNIINNAQRVLNLGDASTQTNGDWSSDLGLRSYFGRVNYTYDGKYLFEANARRDGSSRFASSNRWGTFPSFSGGWIISKEAFMKNVNWLSFAKIRASWGQLGNQNINANYTGSDILSSGQNYSFGGSLFSGVAVTSLTNKELTWETAQQTNIGVDMSLRYGFDLTVDYFDKRTKNLLLPSQVPVTLALSAPYVNAGEVQNKGIEASLTYKKTLSNGLKIRTTLNVAHIVNKITKMNVAEQLGSPKAIKVGYAINSFYGYKMDGIYQLSDFNYNATNGYTLKPGVVSVTNYTAQPGDFKFKDLNGDGVVDMNNDRTVIGKQFPDLNYSLNMNFEWKGFDLGVFLQGVSGIQGYFYYELAAPFSGIANLGSWWMDRWTPSNPTNAMPRVTLKDVHTNVHSTFYMENAAYLRVKNIELGYTINPKILSKAGISSLRIYGNVQNAFTFSKFKGFDPEQTVDQTRAEAFPQVRIITTGLNVNF